MKMLVLGRFVSLYLARIHVLTMPQVGWDRLRRRLRDVQHHYCRHVLVTGTRAGYSGVI